MSQMLAEASRSYSVSLLVMFKFFSTCIRNSDRDHEVVLTFFA